MRIDAYNQISQIYQTTKPKASSTGKNNPSSFSDALELSQAGRDLGVAREAVKNEPDIREDRVQAIKQQMAAGTYHVSAGEIAEKMVSGIFDQRY